MYEWFRVMEYYSDDNDISWLTQVPSLEVKDANFDICDGFSIGDFDVDRGSLVSLQDDRVSKHVLYDNAVAEDISSDEEINKL